MVSIAALGSATTQLVQGLSADDSARLEAALDYASEAYRDKVCTSGQNALEFALGVASTLAFLRTDAETRLAGLMFELTVLDPKAVEGLEGLAGKEATDLVTGVRQLIRLRDMTVGKEAVGKAQAHGRRPGLEAGEGAVVEAAPLP